MSKLNLIGLYLQISAPLFFFVLFTKEDKGTSTAAVDLVSGEEDEDDDKDLLQALLSFSRK